ncbi:MAG: Peptidase domain protein [Verrucomicrobiales bacterium]|nr:Peptidase domain protein [Verrucomicrobiales bacterium]
MAISGILLGLLILPLSLHAQQVPVVEKHLSNGMKLLLLQRKDEPTVSGGFVAHVGSSNEREGITGIAHLFEHMMFKGTPTIGTKDYKKDLQIIQEQEKVRDEMREEEKKTRDAYRKGLIEDPAKFENQTDTWRELEKKFKDLIAQQREVQVKNEFDKIYTSNGGSGMNAYTSQDMTAYFITVPANKLELWMWMESGRLFQPVFREFYAERDVVFEERRMRTDSTPLGKFAEQFEALFWESHPYHWPVIGWPSDIPAISKAQADEFYGIYYAPQNITVVLVGNFDPEQATTMAEKYFGRIPKGKKEAPDVVTLEVGQMAEKRMYAEAETNPQVDINWHTVGFGHKDSYTLGVLAQILSTRTGRLYKGMVLGSKVSTETWAQQESMKWSGFFNMGGEASEGKTPEEVEKAIYAELDKLKTSDVPSEELQKVKNNFAANEYRKLGSNNPILMQLLHYDGLGNWKEINEANKKYQEVTASDIKAAANKYFTKENRTVGIYTRKGVVAGKGEADNGPAGLNSQQKQNLKQLNEQLAKETDTKQMKTMLERMESEAGKVPPDQKAFMEAVKAVIEARISTLEKK